MKANDIIACISVAEGVAKVEKRPGARAALRQALRTIVALKGNKAGTKATLVALTATLADLKVPQDSGVYFPLRAMGK